MPDVAEVRIFYFGNFIIKKTQYFRVKTEEDADEMLAKINDLKDK